MPPLPPFQFATDLERLADVLEQNVGLVIQHTAFRLFKGIVENSPVKTGRFRSNWQIGVGGTPPQIPEDAPIRSDEGTIIAEELRKVNPDNPFHLYVIFNGLPYAQRLEDGWSSQQPNGMVGITLAAVEAGFKQLIKEA